MPMNVRRKAARKHVVVCHAMHGLHAFSAVPHMPDDRFGRSAANPLAAERRLRAAGARLPPTGSQVRFRSRVRFFLRGVHASLCRQMDVSRRALANGWPGLHEQANGSTRSNRVI